MLHLATIYIFSEVFKQLSELQVTHTMPFLSIKCGKLTAYLRRARNILYCITSNSRKAFIHFSCLVLYGLVELNSDHFVYMQICFRTRTNDSSVYES